MIIVIWEHSTEYSAYACAIWYSTVVQYILHINIYVLHIYTIHTARNLALRLNLFRKYKIKLENYMYYFHIIYMFVDVWVQKNIKINDEKKIWKSGEIKIRGNNNKNNNNHNKSGLLFHLFIFSQRNTLCHFLLWRNISKKKNININIKSEKNE